MSRQDLLLWVFCLIGDELKALNLPRPRTRGRRVTTLTDAEVITIERVGEFWGLGTDAAIYRHFRAYHAAEVPRLAEVPRTTSARQAANLWAVRPAPHRRLADRLGAGQAVWLVDGFPLPACQFARATFCARSAGEADDGYDHCVKRTFYGFRVRPRTDRAGVIQDFDIAPARASDRAPLPEMAGPAGIGDRGYYSPALAAELAEGGVRFPTPYPHKSKGPDPARAARRGAVPAGDGQRPAGRGVPGEADVGAGPMAPDQPGDPEGAQPHRDGLAGPPPRAPHALLRQPRTGGLNSHVALATRSLSVRRYR